MVLADDNFASITHAVEEGRTVYDNLRKALLFILPTNGAQALVVVAATSARRRSTDHAGARSWVNMVTAVTLALALAFEPTEAHAMRRPPCTPANRCCPAFRCGASVRILAAGHRPAGTVSLGNRARPTTGRGAHPGGQCAGDGDVYLFNSRFIYSSAPSWNGLLGSRPCRPASAMSWLQLAFTYLPLMQALLGTAPISAADWDLWPPGVMVVWSLVQLEKAAWRWWRNRVIALKYLYKSIVYFFTIPFK